MPPKKDPEGSEGENDQDAIADATSRILTDSENALSQENASANSRNSTKTQKRENETASSTTGPGETSGSPASQKQKRKVDKDRLPGPYVPADLSYALQETQIQLRRMTGEKISQSLIIECALEICLRDFENKGSESGLAKLVKEKYYEQK